VSGAAVSAADAHNHRAGVEIEPRRQWPSGMAAIGVPLRGKIDAVGLVAPKRSRLRRTC
jgi:ATP-dependent DNA helicase RecQ